MTKRIFYLVLSAVIVLALGIALFSFLHRPYDDLVTIPRLSDATSSEDFILAAVSNSDSTSLQMSYYEIEGSVDFSELFAFSNWYIADIQPTGEPLVIFRFAEGWILELYAEDLAIAHNGYAATHTLSECYYSVPSGLLTTLSDYLSIFGLPHHSGDGTISTSTFHW